MHNQNKLRMSTSNSYNDNDISWKIMDGNLYPPENGCHTNQQKYFSIL